VPTAFLVNTARTSRRISATDADAPSTSTMAGAPVDISAAIIWAAK
jgi:hypothetical protein